MARTLILEDFVPYDRSAAWQIHDAYYAERGTAAWTGGDIPFAASNNSGVARQHARLLVALVRELAESGALAADEPVNVLEVGSGLGTFAMNFVEALAHGCGAEGRDLVARLRYVLSDYAQRNLEESTAHPALARLVEAGTVVPAPFDFRKPDQLELPGSRKARGKENGGELVAVIANYVCCVSPQKVIRQTSEGLFEKYVSLSVEVDDAADAKRVTRALTSGAGLPPRELLERIKETVEWHPLDLKKAFSSKHHRELVDEVFETFGDATINYPHVFLDLLRGLRPRLKAGGMFLVSDFGNPDMADVQGPTNDREPVKYGLSLTHEVDFAVFDAFAASEGLGVLRTENGLLDLHTVALLDAPDVTPSFAKAFERTHERSQDGQDLLDLSAAGALMFDAGRHHEAARLYRLCLGIAPRSPQVIYRYGRACLAANVQSVKTLENLARRLRLGKRLDASKKHDWDALLAETYLRLGAAERARRILKRSLAQSETAAKHATLALVYERLGERSRAFASHLRALELAPEGEAAAAAREKLFRDYLVAPGARVRWSRRRGRR